MLQFHTLHKLKHTYSAVRICVLLNIIYNLSSRVNIEMTGSLIDADGSGRRKKIYHQLGLHREINCIQKKWERKKWMLMNVHTRWEKKIVFE